MKGFLAFAFALNCVVFFLIFAKNSFSKLSGAPLLIISGNHVCRGYLYKENRVQTPDPTWRKVLTAMWVLLVFLYPLFGLSWGTHIPLNAPPVMPCPQSVSGLAVVTPSAVMVDSNFCILLLPWSLARSPKCLGVLDRYDDCILFLQEYIGWFSWSRIWFLGLDETSVRILSKSGVIFEWIMCQIGDNPLRKLVYIYLLLLLTLTASTLDPNEQFIQGTWEIAQPDAKNEFFQWRFSRGMFTREQQIDREYPLYTTGSYQVIESNGDDITLELFDFSGDRISNEKNPMTI